MRIINLRYLFHHLNAKLSKTLLNNQGIKPSQAELSR
jgi:hypothetical protein